MIREPAVSGRFYPSDPGELKVSVKGYLGAGSGENSPATGVIVPHAGYTFSGPTAGKVFGGVRVPDSVIILGPNHYGAGPDISVMAEGTWAMPGFESVIDSALAYKILDACPGAAEDFSAHLQEHSIEVQLPFIHYSNPAAKFLPVSILSLSREELGELASAIASAVKDSSGDVLIAASSDMSHYVSPSEARRLDMLAVEKIRDLDAEGLLETVRGEGISMCGVLPAAVMIMAAGELGAEEGRLVDYSTSGDALPGSKEVVGYAGVEIL